MPEIWSRCLRFKKQIGFGVVIFFSASLGFSAGYAARARTTHAPILIEVCSHQ